MIGQVLGGRYEVLDRIGGGGMALVYKAHDILLNRKVAIKFLRPQYVHDEEFIFRFRREAQSAASLSHPNVVSIYDVGQKDDTYYIVMEFIEGMTLNDLIKDKAPMQVEEAVNIAGQICDALDHAHSNQIIHRDIKPHNILIGNNGRVKVTDFGIALAGTNSSITQTGSVVGSVHYFSPEHAKGTAAGAKSDLYSLGIVLYQMLTGRLPFSGESPVSVALKHLQENVEEPRKLNPLIPQSVENIILKVMRKNPDERYQSAKEMLQDLETCLRPERRNEPKLIFPSDDDDDEERTRIVPAIRDNGTTGKRGESKNGSSKKKKAWLKPTIWAAVLLLIIVGLWFTAGWLQKSMKAQDVTIPNVEGKNVVQAQTELTEVGLKWELYNQASLEVEKDKVIKQLPSGMKTKKGNIIKLWVSTGAELQTMDDYKGKSFDQVKDALLQVGLKDIQILRQDVPSDEPEGSIIQQAPKAGDQYDPTKVNMAFTVSKGREKIIMPDLTGNTLNQVNANLQVLKLKLLPENISYKPNFQQKKGLVYDQFPYKAGDEVDPGATDLKIFISTGLPDNAAEYLYNLPPIAPKKEGTASAVKIVVNDARGENEFITKQITKPESFNVPVVVTPDKPATIQVYLDGSMYNTYTFTHKDYTDSRNKPSATPSPNASTSSTTVPTKTPANTGKTATPTATPKGR